MKRMIFGAMLFLGGLFGTLILIAVALSNKVSYGHDFIIGPLMGQMLAQGIIEYFVLLCFIGVVGLIICIYEAYIKNIVLAKKNNPHK